MMIAVGGRPPKVHMDDIIRAGRDLGMRQLSVKAVAAELGVTPTALYRHVDGRWGLERLVGEDLLSELELRDNPAHDPVQHLLSCALQLRAFILRHPGLAMYVQTLFPRGEGGRRLLAAQTRALERRGYSAEAGMVLCSAVAGLAIGYAAGEQARQERADGLDEQRRESVEMMRADASLAAHRALPEIDPDEYVRMWLGAAISGFVQAAPPGRTVDEIRTALHAAGEGM